MYNIAYKIERKYWRSWYHAKKRIMITGFVAKGKETGDEVFF